MQLNFRIAALSAALTASVLSTASAAQLTTVEAGFQITGTSSFADRCADGPSYASFADGSYLAFDGYDIEHRTAGGALLRRFASFPFYTFPSFVRLSTDESTAYVGESSNGEIYTVDLASGQVTQLVNLTFNFDFALDATPGFAYVSAATGAFGENFVHRVDLMTGFATEVIAITGFSGPLTVNSAGDVLLAKLPDTFPFPAASFDILRFDNADLDSISPISGALTVLDASVELAGLNGCSSLQHDPARDVTYFMETNAGASGFGSVLQTVSPGGAVETIAESTAFSGSIEVQDSGIGTHFGAFQPGYVGVSFIENDCFGTAQYQRVDIRGLRPVGSFDGPFLGNGGAASFDVTGGIPDGFASLWIARSGAFTPIDVIEMMGGVAPIALRASAQSFGRRFPITMLDFEGAASFPFMQDVSIEGAILGQWLIFDTSGGLVTSSTFAINRSPF